MDNDTIHQLLDAATPGPWQIGELLPNTVFNWSFPPDHPEAVIADAFREANARLIAAAPYLAAEVLRLREQYATLDALYARCNNDFLAICADRDRLTNANSDLRADLAVAREALAFYSCKDGCNDCSENERDLIGCGWAARAALARITQEDRP